MSLPLSLFVGLVLSSLIGFLAYRRGSLTSDGVLGAILTGTAIFGFGGFVPGLLLVTFFISSTLLSNFQARHKEYVSEKFQKGSRRDLGQALANGGWAALLAISYGLADWLHIGEQGKTFLFAAFVGAIATVTADTWATEIGVLSKTLPRMITSGRIVPAGTSGGITPLGTFTAFTGAALIGAMVNIGTILVVLGNQGGALNLTILYSALARGHWIVLIAGVSGLLGSLFDSLLGATVQAIFFSEYDERQTEKQVDSQGNPTRQVRGWRWLDNDLVNFFASVGGSLVAAGLALILL